MDKLLHILLSSWMLLVLYPIINWYSLIPVIIVGIGKEFFDLFIQKDNTYKQSLEDIIANIIGILISIGIIFIWKLF